MPIRKMMTLHAPIAKDVALKAMTPLTDLLDQFGFKSWLSTDDLPNLTLMVEVPQVWVERGPTGRELEMFHELYDSGRIAAAREFAQTGFPEYLR